MSVESERFDYFAGVVRAGMKREVARILDIFASMFRDAGSHAKVLRVKRAAPSWQTVQDIAKAEWERQPGNPRIEWVDTSVN
jgi:hypothetical protein